MQYTDQAYLEGGASPLRKTPTIDDQDGETGKGTR
jgi:hypothetical protein